MSRTRQTDPKAIRAARRVASSSKPLRIVEQAPREGFHHPADARQVREFLQSMGAVAHYGLREIRLRRAPSGAALIFGRYHAPGRIELFEQAHSPWLWPGSISRKMIQWLSKRGAVLDKVSRSIEWPGDTLRKLMLEEVLLHEVGHHHLQHYSGKRPVARARVADHEAFARLFVRRAGHRIRKT